MMTSQRKQSESPVASVAAVQQQHTGPGDHVTCRTCAQESTKTAMMRRAQAFGHVTCLAAVIEQGGADVNEPDRFGQTAFMNAVYRGNHKCVELLQAGADVNVQDAEGATALMMAVERKDVILTKLLLKAGADVNVKDRIGDTALVRAVKIRSIILVKLLLHVGAQVNVYNYQAVVFNGVMGHIIQKVLFAAGESRSDKKNGGKIDENLKKDLMTGFRIELSHLCRKAIRNHLLQMSNVNLFVRVERLGLPATLQKYILYDQSIIY